MKVSIVIPAYNEIITLPTLLKKLKQLNLHHELIIVDDGSDDGTTAYLQQLSDPDLVILFNEHNRGKGFSIRRALTVARGDIIVTQDADLEYDPEDLHNLLKPFQENAQVVYGSRILKADNNKSYLRYYLGGRFLTFVVNLLFGSRLSDESTGYKLFRKEILSSLNLQCKGFEFCPEVTAKLLRKKVPIEEIPISYHPRSFSEGKKISWKDGLNALYVILKYRLLPQNSGGASDDKPL